jgi:hypothetical protein
MRRKIPVVPPLTSFSGDATDDGGGVVGALVVDERCYVERAHTV